MKLNSTTACAILSCILISGCATTTQSNPISEEARQGEVLSGVDYSKIISGNTITGEEGNVIYYNSNGVKLSRLANGDMVVRSWYLDDAGKICQTLNSDEKLDCLRDDFVAYKTDRTISAQFSNGGKIYKLVLTEGNSENLTAP